jgi:hypothetical protein
MQENSGALEPVRYSGPPAETGGLERDICVHLSGYAILMRSVDAAELFTEIK